MSLDLDALQRRHCTVYDGAIRLLTAGTVPDAESAAMTAHSTWKEVGKLLMIDHKEARERARACADDLRSKGNGG